MTLSGSQVGYSGINMTGGGGVRRIFLGLKFSTPVFFGVEDLTMYFFGSEKSARIFLGSNFRQANSSYAIKKSCIFLGLKFPVLYFCGCTI